MLGLKGSEFFKKNAIIRDGYDILTKRITDGNIKYDEEALLKNIEYRQRT